MRLEKKVAVITGAGSGMGRAMAIRFAAEGAKLMLGDWHGESLEGVVKEVRDAGGEAHGLQGNIAVRAEAEALVDAAMDHYGRIDVLCNNAGVMDVNQGVAEVTDEMWERVLSINLNGPMYASRRAVPIMVKQGGGAIVNTDSMAGLVGGVAGAAYTAAKHALAGLTKNTAWIYGPQGVRCNAIAAGAVETNIMQSVDPSKMDPTGSARLQVRYGTIPGQLQADDIASLALFLASDDARNINGAIVPADAGWAAG
jgi:NAD(P)-dependent dehydrogenase (short-subunit alcohol dehydrogenase family)